MDIPDAYRIDALAHGLVPSLGDPHALDHLARYLQNMDEVIVNCPLDQRAAWSQALKGSGVHGEVTSELVREIGVLGVIHRNDANVSTLLVSTGPLGIRARITKRAFDLAASAAALVLLSPVLLLAALAVKLEDGGPVFFRQRRLGRGNRFFWIYKLRTMRVESSDADGNRSAGRTDDRVTRVGHFLRPGITGLAQVRGFRGATDKESDLSSRLQADLEYLSGWSIWRDIKISFATLRVLVHEQAY